MSDNWNIVKNNHVWFCGNRNDFEWIDLSLKWVECELLVYVWIQSCKHELNNKFEYKITFGVKCYKSSSKLESILENKSISIDTTQTCLNQFYVSGITFDSPYHKTKHTWNLCLDAEATTTSFHFYVSWYACDRESKHNISFLVSLI